jgi:hypothetical protein
MSIVPTEATAPGVTGTTGPAGATDPAGAGDFLAAILQALAPTADQPTAAPAAPAAAAPGVPAADPTALGLVVPPGLVAQLTPTPVVAEAGTGSTADAGVAATPAAPGPANVADGAAVATTGPTGDIRMSGDVLPAATAPAAPERADAPAPAKDPDVAQAFDRADAGPATADPGAVASAAATARTGSDADASTPDPSTAPAPMAPIAAPSPAPAVSRAEPASTTGTQHVTGQVFPEVSRLVSRGDGTHRITLDLNPESLGEVRVVMTVRDGAVHVRFAAGHEAGRALLDGSAELNRLLGAAGANETRIVVRDLSAATQPTTTGFSAGPDLGPGPGGDRSPDQHAGTRAEHLATDGSDTTPGNRGPGANPSRSIQPVTRTRLAGVDVTM